MQNKKLEKDFFNLKADEYDKDYHSYEEFVDLITKLILKIPLNQNKIINILECGCGAGNIGSKLIKKLKKNVKITGVDISENMIEMSKKRNTENYITICDDLEDKSLFKNTKFDIIISCNFLHHFKNPNIIINNFSEWAINSSFIIIIEPNGDLLINKLSKIVRLFLDIFNKKNLINYGFSSPNETTHTADTYDNIFSNHMFKKFLKGQYEPIYKNELNQEDQSINTIEINFFFKIMLNIKIFLEKKINSKENKSLIYAIYKK